MMQVVHHLEDVNPAGFSEHTRSFVTVGVFDGLHRGHQRIIGGLARAAHEAGQDAVVVTFDPHPSAVLGESAPLLLTTMGERLDLMADLEVDTVVVFPFTDDIVHTPARDFVNDLLTHLDMMEIRVGPDFALGHGQQGDISYLKQLGGQLGFQVRVIEPVTWQGSVVHSSRIREALQRGDVDAANGCLGRAYRLSGVVGHGRGRGRSIGVPTANIDPPPNRLIPVSGVYACRASTERGEAYAAAVNVGTRPTFTGQSDPQGLTVEAHLLDFDRDLYNEVLGIDFLARLRDEQAYPTLNALVAQMREDIAQTRALLAESTAESSSPPSYSSPPISKE